MAAVETEWEKCDESLKLFAEAEQFVGKEINFSVDYSRAVGLAGIKRKDDALINDAFDNDRTIHRKRFVKLHTCCLWIFNTNTIGTNSFRQRDEIDG